MIKEYVVSFIENFHSFELKDVNHPLNLYLLCDDRILSTAGFMCGVVCIVAVATVDGSKPPSNLSGLASMHLYRDSTPKEATCP